MENLETEVKKVEKIELLSEWLTLEKYSFKDFEGTLADAECMKLAGISRNSYYKYKAELKAAGE